MLALFLLLGCEPRHDRVEEYHVPTACGYVWEVCYYRDDEPGWFYCWLTDDEQSWAVECATIDCADELDALCGPRPPGG